MAPRRLLNVRLSEAGVAEIDRVREREQLPDRAAAIRLILAYGCRYLPRGWTGKELT